MLIHPRDAAYTLLDVTDVMAEPPPAAVAPYVASLRSVVTWFQTYLCRPHPQLGRTGNVCPYAQGALDRGTLYLSVTPGVLGLSEVRERLRVYRDWLLELSAEAGSARTFQAIVMVFPDLPARAAPAVIDRIQGELKSDYVSRGLMIGEFHDGPPEKSGLWNADFRPLRSPVPLLAIRHMVATDFLFLESDRDQVRKYLDLFAPQVPPQIRSRIAARAQQAWT